MNIYIYIYIYIYVCIYMYVCIYIYICFQSITYQLLTWRVARSETTWKIVDEIYKGVGLDGRGPMPARARGDI